MSKFCGNCGTVVDDTDKVCGNCGKSLGTNNKTTKIPVVNYVDSAKKAKTTKLIEKIVGIIGIIMIIAVAFNGISGLVGYKGTIRKIMEAYENYDIDTIISLSSDLYFSMSDDEYVEDYFGNIISSDLDNYEASVGHKYELSYDITDAYEMSKHKYEKLLDSLSSDTDFDSGIIKKAMVVNIEVTAKGKSNTKITNLKITLTKEDDSWKILYLDKKQ